MCLIVFSAHGLTCAENYFENTLDLSSLSADVNGTMYAAVSEYTTYNYASMRGQPRCEAYDNNLSGNWFGTDEGGTCRDCRFDNMKYADWYVEFDRSAAGYSNLRGTSACIYSTGSYTVPNYNISISNGSRQGMYCWCKLTSIDEISVSGAWVYDGNNSNTYSSTCHEECARWCAQDIKDKVGMRRGILSTVSGTVTGCSAVSQQKYDILYDLDGGTQYSDAPICYKITSGDVYLNSPTKSGDTFVGWTDENGKSVNQLTIGDTDKIYLNAHWRSDVSCSYGMYLSDMTCVNVGAGYYSPDGDINRYACPNSLTTIGFGLGADNVNDCGYVLRLGTSKLYLSNTQKTHPALAIRIGNNVYYANITPVLTGGAKYTSAESKLRLHALVGDIEYTIHDDSVN